MKREKVLLSVPATIILFFAATLLLGSCRVYRSTDVAKTTENNCELDSLYTYKYAFHPSPDSIADDSVLQSKFSERSLFVARATGVTPVLKQLVQLSKDGSSRSNLNDRLLLRQQIYDHMQLANFDIASVAAEIDCGVKRALTMADVLNRKENLRTKRITIVSIAVGAITAFVGGVLQVNEHSSTGEIVDITGGLIGASTALSVLLIRPPLAEYQHPRNPLFDVVNPDKETRIFPPAVWYYLTHSSDGKRPVVEVLRDRWASTDLSEEMNKGVKFKEVVYFDTGGVYDSKMLAKRASMLGQLEAEVKLMNDDLKVFLNELVRVL